MQALISSSERQFIRNAEAPEQCANCLGHASLLDTAAPFAASSGSPGGYFEPRSSQRDRGVADLDVC
jgi:hypothetical protein